MAMNWRRGGFLAAAIGVIALAGCDAGGDRSAGAAAKPGPTATSITVAAPPRVDCSFAQIVKAASREDGMLPLDKDLQGRTAAAVNTLVLSGKEAAAAGKPRDAEAAFLMACRSAEKVKGNPMPLADAHYQLGRHYAQVAAAPDVPRRDEMFKRSQLLYASSLYVYAAEKGPDHERTRFAREGLEKLQQLAGGSLQPLPAAPAADVKTAANDERAAQQTRIAGAAPQTQQAATPAVAAAAAQANAREQAQAQAEAQAGEQARLQAEAQAREQARVQAEAQAREQVRVQAEAQAREQARMQAEAQVQARAHAKAQAEAQAREQARLQAEARDLARAQAEARSREQARVQAEARAREQARAQEEERVAAAAPSAPPARRASPSFDCAKARSTTERLICADDDLARQDRELGRIFDRAKRAAPDPRAFQRDSDAEWQRREDTCRDRECLQRWYAQRRAQLSAQAEAEPREPRRQAPAPREVQATTPRMAEPAARAPRVLQRAEPAEIVIDAPATATGSTE